MRKLEYIWIDGSSPTPQLRSKTKVVDDASDNDLPTWGFDGSSTGQAETGLSDCILAPIFACLNPLGDPTNTNGDLLVFCEVYTTELESHESNTRRNAIDTLKPFTEHELLFGFEQEYTLFEDGQPLGFPKKGKPDPQGKYYCGVGTGKAFGRGIAEEHLELCLKAGLSISGINAEVMPGQWEFQVGPLDPIQASDQLWVARWLLHRVAEQYGITVSFDPKPVMGDWNGAGCHANVSTKEMRGSYDACIRACEALNKKHRLHIKNYGAGIKKRLTGQHETCTYNEFSFGVSDRGASVRIPWQVARKEGEGYIEDRRPNANCDPYVVSRLIGETICS
jgi:glutamine synthetase